MGRRRSTLWPAASRPYIGGSQTNSILELTFGYNGLGRLTGDEVGSVGGGAAGQAGRWGITGITRLFQSDWGGQIAWLIPAAAHPRRRLPGHQPARAAHRQAARLGAAVGRLVRW